jgi:hypothetical protein
LYYLRIQEIWAWFSCPNVWCHMSLAKCKKVYLSVTSNIVVRFLFAQLMHSCIVYSCQVVYLSENRLRKSCRKFYIDPREVEKRLAIRKAVILADSKGKYIEREVITEHCLKVKSIWKRDTWKNRRIAVKKQWEKATYCVMLMTKLNRCIYLFGCGCVPSATKSSFFSFLQCVKNVSSLFYTCTRTSILNFN